MDNSIISEKNSIISKKNSIISKKNSIISDSKKKTHILDLPYEILEVIFKNLENTDYQAYINSSMVCRQWRYMLHKNFDVIMVKEHAKVLFFEDLLDHTDEDIINFSGLLTSSKTWIKACRLNKYNYRFEELEDYYHNKYEDYMYEKLDNEFCDNLQCKGLALFPNLMNICINFNSAIKDLNFLKYCPLVEFLDVGDNDNLKDISSISELYKLKDLNLGGCKIKDLAILKNLKNIEKLFLSECDILESLDGLENNSKLQELDCNDCFCLKNLDALEELHNIHQLQLSTCNLYLNKVPILGSYDKVNTLDISFCDNLRKLDGLDKYKELKHLNIECSDSITDFNVIKKLNNIKTINMTCDGVTDEIYKNIQEHFINNNIHCAVVCLN